MNHILQDLATWIPGCPYQHQSPISLPTQMQLRLNPQTYFISKPYAKLSCSDIPDTNSLYLKTKNREDTFTG